MDKISEGDQEHLAILNPPGHRPDRNHQFGRDAPETCTSKQRSIEVLEPQKELRDSLSQKDTLFPHQAPNMKTKSTLNSHNQNISKRGVEARIVPKSSMQAQTKNNHTWPDMFPSTWHLLKTSLPPLLGPLGIGKSPSLDSLPGALKNESKPCPIISPEACEIKKSP